MKKTKYRNKKPCEKIGIVVEGRHHIVRVANQGLELGDGRKIKKGQCLSQAHQDQIELEKAVKKALEKYGVD